MPFNNQQASKVGHEDILRNPDIDEYLSSIGDIPRPAAAELAEIFGDAPAIGEFKPSVPEVIVAFDGSLYEASADTSEPSRRVGYVKVGMVALNVKKYIDLSDQNMPYVDPMAVNRLQDRSALSMALPSAYLKEPALDSVTDGYRAAVHRYYSSDKTKVGTDKNTLLDTVVELLYAMDAVVEENGAEYVVLPSCPGVDCDAKNVGVPLKGEASCRTCEAPLFVTDMLRVWECFNEASTNAESFSRLMLASESLVLLHSLLFFKRAGLLAQLSNYAFIMDGPLSISGEAAKFHEPIMKTINQLQLEMIEHNLVPPLVMGLTKTGIAVEHFAALDESIPTGIAFPVTDEYRYKNIFGKKVRAKPFGDEFYYGQDVLIKTPEGRQFLVSLPYPWDTKQDADFKTGRFDLSKYRNVDLAIGIINMFQSDLYENSMVPVILAHEYASISLAPGGKILDLATARALGAA
jgi:hypothetical protein